jgi:signal transduction histidine kinase/FixJ family two-component response regulator
LLYDCGVISNQPNAVQKDRIMDGVRPPDPLHPQDCASDDRSDAERTRLQRQADTFFSLIANNPFGVYLIDAEFRLRVVSLGAQKVFANVRPLIGRDFTEVLRVIWPEPFATEAIGQFRNTLASGVPYEAPTTVEPRADVPVIEAYDWRIERVTMPDDSLGGSFGVVCYFYDLTEREQWSRKLEEREAQLRTLTVDLERRVHLRTTALNAVNERLTAEIERREATQAALVQSQKLEALGQLTSGIAHDFNNIMGAVLGGFSIIANRTVEPDLLKVAAMGKNAAERGAALVRQLMAFARAELPEPQRIALPAALAEVRGLISHGLHRNVALRVDCPDTVWPAIADPSQLQSALLNLAINANDAMPDGGELAIVVANAPAIEPDHPAELAGRDAVRIVVADTGLGMESHVLQRVMEPFFTTKDKGRGTGLGLAMVQGFVLQAGGAIRIESRPGAGTTFSITLPRAPVEDEVSGLAASDSSRIAPERAFETVLLVDDDADVLGVIEAGLADFGFEVLTSTNAHDAIAMLQTRAVDALVSDIDLPGMSGIELVAHVRRTGPAIPCLLMTGGGMSARWGADAPEGDTVLLKPFDPQALRDALHATLTGRDHGEADGARLDRLAARLQADGARSLFAHWRALQDQSPLPGFDRFDLNACSDPGNILIAEVDLGRVPIDFRVTAGGHLPLGVGKGEGPPAREAALRRCALTGAPAYEFMLLAAGGDRFERLLLPFSSNGRMVDRIVGAVVVVPSTVITAS